MVLLFSSDLTNMERFLSIYTFLHIFSYFYIHSHISVYIPTFMHCLSFTSNCCFWILFYTCNYHNNPSMFKIHLQLSIVAKTFLGVPDIS